VAAVEQPVLTVERDGVLLVTLNRPAVRNAIDAPTAAGVAAALAELDDRDDLRVGVLTGAEDTFSAGMDLRAFAHVQAEGEAERALGAVVRRRPAKPLVAAVEGFAVGGGCEIALACDLIVAARDARFGVPEVRHSLVPAGGALLRLPQRLPFGVAMEMALTGAQVSAERLHEHGLVNRLVEPGAALEAALALAAQIVANGPLAVAASKRILWGQLDWATDEFWARQDEILAPVNASEDAREGVRAFAEKRPPVWRGR
jgi:enoyl-CoA hydratase